MYSLAPYARHAGERTHVIQATEPLRPNRDDIEARYNDLVYELPVTERLEVLRNQRPRADGDM